MSKLEYLKKEYCVWLNSKPKAEKLKNLSSNNTITIRYNIDLENFELIRSRDSNLGSDKVIFLKEDEAKALYEYLKDLFEE